MIVKYSYGIILFRNNNGKPEALVTQRRTTYAFDDFVLGLYNPNNISALAKLFNNMSVHEKAVILSMRFDYIWYMFRLENSGSNERYSICRKHFLKSCLFDGGELLKTLINNSKHGVPMYEFPKGRRHKDEYPLNCAVREFKEETGIDKKYYNIIPGITRKITSVTNNTKYIVTYYYAISKRNFDVRINFKNHEQIFEINDIRWMTLKEIGVVNNDKRLVDLSKPLFNYTLKHFT